MKVIAIVLSMLQLLAGSCSLCGSAQSYPRVTTPLGIIEGFYNTSSSGQIYSAFRGIPFAQPPTGEARFQVAESILPWKDVLMAKKFGSSCMQYNFASGDPRVSKVSGSEDCLYLNIYTPAIATNASAAGNRTARKRKELFPVIFYIPGGAFVVGSGADYGPKYLLDHKVTLVTINYRLGPMGFLNTEDEIVPGNAGLKDQTIALRWVKNNIKYFGGDPSRITLFGQSAGAVSVHYHYLTSLSVGLFQRGMSMSGSALNPWAYVEKPLEKAQKLAKKVECPIDDNEQMVKCLRSKSATIIMEAVGEFVNWPMNPPNGWGPSTEAFGSSDFTFIDCHPIDVINDGNVQDLPWVTGVVSNEFLYPMSVYMSNSGLFESLNNKWEEAAPYVLSYNDTIPPSERKNVANSIRQNYLGDKPISKATFNQSVQMQGDRVFVHGVEKAARAQALINESPVYAYYFAYRGTHSFTELLTRTSENYGVCHGDDLQYVLTSSLNPVGPESERDQKMQRIMTQLWVSYATNGKLEVGGVEWDNVKNSQKDEFNYLRISGPDDISMESSSNFGQEIFWDSIDSKENLFRSNVR